MTCLSEIISEPAGRYIRRRTWHILRAWLWLIAAVAVATATAACHDGRFLYVLLIELFIIFPMAIGPVWVIEGCSPYARMAVTPHRVGISVEGVSIEYMTGEEYHPIESEKYGWNAFRAFHDAGKSVILEWADKKRPGLRLPEYAFDAAQWQQVARILAQSL